MFDLIERGSSHQAVATIPEFFWELSFDIYLIVKGFKPPLRQCRSCRSGRASSSPT